VGGSSSSVREEDCGGLVRLRQKKKKPGECFVLSLIEVKTEKWKLHEESILFFELREQTYRLALADSRYRVYHTDIVSFVGRRKIHWEFDEWSIEYWKK
jgi:hypothetical protein